MRTVLFLAVWCCIHALYGQKNTLISGTIKDAVTKRPVQNVKLQLDGSSKEFLSDDKGGFAIWTGVNGEHILNVVSSDYVLKRIPVFLTGETIELGIIFLEKDVVVERSDNLITLTENDISNDDETISGSSGLLQATRDIFLSRAAFDFGQAFFRVRGYDSHNGVVMLNGIPMNKFFNGRPQWNNWSCFA